MANDATFGQVHDAFRTFTEFADLKPKTASQNLPQGGTSTPGFSIQIVLGAPPDPNSKNVTIDVTPERLARENPFVAST